MAEAPASDKDYKMNPPMPVKGLKLEKPITLIGMMGTGKSTLGAMLAQRLALPFFDSDQIIVAQRGKTIPQIFADDGEAYFRAMEVQTLSALLNDHPLAVIATGGGAVTNPQTLQSLLDKTIVCWLKSSPAEIYNRIKDDSNRPLITQAADPLTAITNLLESRKNLYARAQVHIDLNDENPLETLEYLVNLFTK